MDGSKTVTRRTGCIEEITVTRIEFRKVPGSERVAVQESLAL
jgi:hypothetical protein